MSVRAAGAAAVTLALLAALAVREAPAAATPDYEVKAAYLFAFLKFVRWSEAENARGGSLDICLAGGDPFQGALQATVENASIGSRPVATRQVAGADDAKTCRVLFIGDSLQPQLTEMLSALGEEPVLTVGEMPRFVERGGMIQFVMQGNRIRFEINKTAAERAGLFLTSELLRVASAVRTSR